MKIRDESPLCARVRRVIHQTRGINFMALRGAARTDAEWRAVQGALRQFKHAHPDRWTEQLLTGSLMKRLRSMHEAA